MKTIQEELRAERKKALVLADDNSSTAPDCAEDYKRQAKAMAKEIRSYNQNGMTGTHADLYSRCNGIIDSYRKDLIFHDFIAIKNNPKRSFIHVSYSSGTHMYFMPVAGDDMNEIVKILFGRNTRRSYHTGIVELLKTHNFESGALITHYNAESGTMRTVGKDAAAALYSAALQAADKR